MSAPSSPRPLSWTARVAVCLPLMALALVVGPAEASQPADGTAGNAAGRSPAGQSPDDGNRGRDCDANPGAGDGNPAFGACTPAPDGDGSDDVGSGKDVVLDLDEGGDEDADVVGGGTVGDDPAGGTEDTGIEGAGVGGTGTESTGTEGTGTEGTGGGTGKTGGGTGETGGGETGTGETEAAPPAPVRARTSSPAARPATS